MLQPVWNLFSIGLLYLSVIWIGLYTKYLTERAQRKAFLETRRSLEMRFKTQKENERQERLLLSVLPSFVAQQVCNLLAVFFFIYYCHLFLSDDQGMCKNRIKSDRIFFLNFCPFYFLNESGKIQNNIII